MSVARILSRGAIHTGGSARTQQEEHARQMTLVESEILGDEQRLLHELHLGQHRCDAGEELRVVVDRRIALGEVDVVGAAGRRTRLVEHAADARTRPVEHAIREHTEAPRDMGLAGHGVADGTGLDEAELADARLLGAELIHQLSLGHQKLGRRECRVMGLPRRHAVSLGDMDARAVDMDMRLARAGQKRPRAARERTGGQIGPHVEAEDAVGVIALEDAALAHGLGPARGLLRRLEHKEHVAPERARVLAQRAVDVRRRGECHSHMSIVPAGMHLARMGRGEGRPRLLRDGQGIHVGTDRRGRSGSRIEERADARVARVRDLAGKRREHALDIGDGLREIEIQLGDAMQVAAITAKFFEFGHNGSSRAASTFKLCPRRILSAFRPCTLVN